MPSGGRRARSRTPFGAALDHVQQPGRAGPVPDAGQIVDDSDVLVAATGVPPDVLIDPDDTHVVEPAGVVDQHLSALGQHRIVRGAPRPPEGLGDPGHGQVRHHDPFQRPSQPATRELRARLGGATGVPLPHVSAAGAAVPPDRDQQRGRPPTRTGSCASRRVTLSRGAPSQPQRRHHRSSDPSDGTTWQASTAQPGSRRCPVTSRPSSSSRQNVVRSASPKVKSARPEPAAGVASCTPRSSGWAV